MPRRRRVVNHGASFFVDADGWGVGVATLDLFDLLSGGLENLNDRASLAAFGDDLAADLSYRVLGRGHYLNSIRIEVRADVRAVLDAMADRAA